MASVPLLQQFFNTRDEYRSNAELAIAAGEYRKASELLWGAVTQQLKALAFVYDVEIRSHMDFYNFTRQLGEEIGDKNFYNTFKDLNSLHRNFYDETFPEDDLPRYYEKVVQYINKIQSLIKKKEET